MSRISVPKAPKLFDFGKCFKMNGLFFDGIHSLRAYETTATMVLHHENSILLLMKNGFQLVLKMALVIEIANERKPRCHLNIPQT